MLSWCSQQSVDQVVEEIWPVFTTLLSPCLPKNASQLNKVSPSKSQRPCWRYLGDSLTHLAQPGTKTAFCISAMCYHSRWGRMVGGKAGLGRWQTPAGTYVLWRTHHPQWGSPEPKHSLQVSYWLHDSTGTRVSCRRKGDNLSGFSQDSAMPIMTWQRCHPPCPLPLVPVLPEGHPCRAWQAWGRQRDLAADCSRVQPGAIPVQIST